MIQGKDEVESDSLRNIGIESLPEDSTAHQFCPKADEPGDPNHNCHNSMTVQIEDGELGILVFQRCSCGYENRNFIH